MFPFLTDAATEEFIGICEYRTYKTKEILLAEGGTSRKVMFILSGFVRGFVRDDDGVEKTIMLRSHGKFASVPEWLFVENPSKYNFEALMDIEILFLTLPDFEDLAKRNPLIFDFYSWAMKENMTMLCYRLETMILMTPEERYKDLLAKFPTLFQAAFNKHIANFLGITPVSLSRLIKRSQTTQKNKTS